MTYCSNCGTNFQLVETQGFCSWGCREADYRHHVERLLVGITEFDNLYHVVDPETNFFYGTFSTLEEAIKEYPNYIILVAI